MKIEKEVTIPSVPNFIKVGNESYGIEEFSNVELREIGKEWTQKLVERAEERAKNIAN